MLLLLISVAYISCVIIFKFILKAALCATETRLDGKIVLITGANTGIGKETAINLAKRGAKVVIACRDMIKGEAALKQIQQESKNEDVYLMKVDLASLESIKTMVSKFIQKFDELNILINNAGVMACPYMKTQDGFEMHIGVNHLGHFVLTNLLLRHMLRSNGPVRIITISSVLHRFGKIRFWDMNSEESYHKVHAYCNSKLANILFTEELQRKVNGSNITAYCVHPGVVYTELGRQGILTSIIYKTFVRMFCKTVIEGAQTTIYCATKEGLETDCGKYFADCKPKTTSNKSCGNKDVAERLWSISEEMTDVRFTCDIFL